MSLQCCPRFSDRRASTLTLLLWMIHLPSYFLASASDIGKVIDKPFAARDEYKPPAVITVQFYGEAQCPYCRKFVQEAWPTVWEDDELMEYVQYDYVAWGNAYFSTAKCSPSSSTSNNNAYDPTERACWYKECIETSPSDTVLSTLEDDNDDDCFSGKVIYQHSEKEGIVDIYENCVKLHYGLETGVDFVYCAEGPSMDDPTLATAHDLLVHCADGIDVGVIQGCYETHGHIMEVLAAKQTPSHPGVPYVVVDGEALDDPFAIRKEICDRLKARMDEPLWSSSSSSSSSFRLPKASTTSTRNEDGEGMEVMVSDDENLHILEIRSS